MFGEFHSLHQNVFSITWITWFIFHFLPKTLSHVPLHVPFPLWSWHCIWQLWIVNFFVNGVQGTSVAVIECLFLERPTIRFMAENFMAFKSITSPLEDDLLTIRFDGICTSLSGSSLLCMDANAFFWWSWKSRLISKSSSEYDAMDPTLLYH